MTATDWVASLSPWPEEFGLGRMHSLLDALDNPQRAFPAVHVVGTNGKSTATRTIAALLRAEGLDVGAYTSPHVSGWHERLDTDPDSFERAVARIRPAAEAVGATQFEALTAAALTSFAERGVAAAVVEAGLGGRLDATNVLDAPVVLLTNVGLEHTDVLGDTREEIAREKLAVVAPGAKVVLPDDEWRELVPDAHVLFGGAREAAEAFVGHPIEAQAEISLPGRLERRGPDEVRDGAHTPEGVAWLLERLEPRRVDDRRVDPPRQGRGRHARAPGRRGTSPRRDTQQQSAFARRAGTRRARRTVLRACRSGRRSRSKHSRRARALGPVLVTGSLYLLADLHGTE